MGEAKRRKLLGLPTQRAIPAQRLIDAGRQLPKPEHEKWGSQLYPGKTLIVHDKDGKPVPPDVVAEAMRAVGKTEAEIEDIVKAMNRPWPSPELNAVPSWFPGQSKIEDVPLEPFPPGGAEEFKRKALASDDGFNAAMQAFKHSTNADFLNKPQVSYEDMASEEYDPVAAAVPYRGQRSFGRKNIYACDSGHETVTVDTAEGVTPFMILCPECSEYARSKVYRVDQTLEATHEWYRPDTLDGVSPQSHDHVKRGGLIMRKIGNNEPEQAAKH